MAQYTLKYQDTNKRPMATPSFSRISFRVYEGEEYTGLDGTLVIAGADPMEAGAEYDRGRTLVKVQQDRLNAANPADGLEGDDALDAVEAWLNSNQQAV